MILEQIDFSENFSIFYSFYLLYYYYKIIIYYIIIIKFYFYFSFFSLKLYRNRVRNNLESSINIPLEELWKNFMECSFFVIPI